MRWFGRSGGATPLEPEPLVVPRASIDGWTLDGTALGEAVPRADRREVSTLLHGVAVGVETPYTYARAVELLLAAAQPGQAHAVCAAWLASPAAARPENAATTRALSRQADRLRQRLQASAPAVAG